MRRLLLIFAFFTVGAFVSAPLALAASTPQYVKQQQQLRPQATGTPLPADRCDAKGNCQTEIGAVPIDPSGFVNAILNAVIPVGGALALILIIYGGFKMVTSSGYAEEVRKGKEIITYAIVGLILILFAVLIVRVIGGGVLQLPEFG